MVSESPCHVGKGLGEDTDMKVVGGVGNHPRFLGEVSDVVAVVKNPLRDLPCLVIAVPGKAGK